MRSHGADAGNLVGRDGDSQTGTADEEATVSLAFADELGSLDGGMRVGGLVGGRVDTHVDDGFNEVALLEVSLDGVFVGNTGLVTGHDNTEGLHVGGHLDVFVVVVVVVGCLMGGYNLIVEKCWITES